MTHKNFRIKWKGSHDLVTLVLYRLDAPEVLKMHLLVSCCLYGFFESEAKKVKAMLGGSWGCRSWKSFHPVVSIFPDLTIKK